MDLQYINFVSCDSLYTPVVMYAAIPYNTQYHIIATIYSSTRQGTCHIINMLDA